MCFTAKHTQLKQEKNLSSFIVIYFIVALFLGQVYLFLISAHKMEIILMHLQLLVFSRRARGNFQR